MSDYVSFADYLGLNDESGRAMLEKTLEGGQGQLDGIQRSADAQLGAAGGAGRGQAAGRGGRTAYDTSGEAVRTGLASYGEFMKGMNDPAARQALMEKTYGKGAVSWLDSALAGGSGGLARAGESFGKFSRDIGAVGARASQRKGDVERIEADYAADAARNEKLRAERKAEFEKIVAENEKKAMDAKDLREGRAHFGENYNPNDAYFGSFLPWNPNKTQGEYMKASRKWQADSKTELESIKDQNRKKYGTKIDPATGKEHY